MGKEYILSVPKLNRPAYYIKLISPHIKANRRDVMTLFVY